jgi:hypothetical protein
MGTKLHLFDFDGTLFRSPGPPKGYTGSWGADPQALAPPYVPTRPGSSWWNQGVIQDARESIADPDAHAILMTGRPRHIFKGRIEELLAQQNLVFEFAQCNPVRERGSTMPWKRSVLMGILDRHPHIRSVTLWDDDGTKIPHYVEALEARGITPTVFHILKPEEFHKQAVERLARTWLHRVAKEFPTEKALKKHLKKHPNADPKDHWVKKDKGDNGGKEDSPKGFVNKLKAKFTKLKKGLAQELAESKIMLGTVGKLVSGGKVSDEERKAAKTQALDVLKGLVSATAGVLPGGSLLFALTAAVNKVFDKSYSWAPSAFKAAGSSPEMVADKLLAAVLKEMENGEAEEK